MGLIGKLEDLPLSDIIQIVFLSRRTGILEIKIASHIYKIFFLKGCLTLAMKDHLIGMDQLLLNSKKHIDEAYLEQARMIHASIPESGLGDILLEMNLCSPAELAKAVFDKIQRLITEILESDEGEFSFELKDAIQPAELGYSPEVIFKHGGIPPEQILSKSSEIGVLKEIRESLIKGKETFKAASQASPERVEEAPPIEQEAEEPLSEELPPEPSPTIELKRETNLIPIDIDIKYQPREESPRLFGKFTLLSKEQDGGEELGYTACILEGDPLLRVTLKRIFTRGGYKVYHYNQTGPFLKKVEEIEQSGDPAVLVMGISSTIPPQEIERCLQTLSGSGDAPPPAFIIHPTNDPLQHKTSYLSGADMVFSRPDLSTLSVKVSEEVLNTFVEDVFIAVGRYARRLPAFAEKQKFHDIAAKEKINRSLTLLKDLILELSNPEDISQVGLMTLRIAAEYLERAVVLMVREEHYVGIGGFGLTGDNQPMNIRVRNIEIPRSADSIFSRVARTLKPHRGKMRRTQWNEYFLSQLGKVFPSEVMIFPIMVRGKMIAMLYGDNAEYKRPIGNTDGFEIFLSQAGYAFEDALKSHPPGEKS